jgi:hypothetical protein
MFFLFQTNGLNDSIAQARRQIPTACVDITRSWLIIKWIACLHAKTSGFFTVLLPEAGGTTHRDDVLAEASTTHLAIRHASG